MIKLNNISFIRDNKVILDNINLTLDNNKFYVITGPNGSGKSTLAKIIMGLEKPDSGTVYLDDIDITNKSINERANLGIGYAFQQPVLFKGITVYDLLKIATKKDLDKKSACDILSRVGLCAIEYVDREINNSLSGGELKRIEIASVLASKPRVTVFDEPEAGIDLWSFRSLNEVFKSLQDDSTGITIVISHQERIMNISDEIILINEGKISKMGPKDKMISTIFKQTICCKGVEFNE